MWILMGLAAAVVGGEATEGEHPEVVAVLHTSGICTGTLIHPEWVSTSAGCFDSTNLSSFDPADLEIRSADLILGPGIEGRTALEIHLHPDYISAWSDLNAPLSPTGEPANDLALVRLATPFPFAGVALNTTPVDDAWVGQDAVFVGYGVTTFEGSGAGIRRAVVAPITAVAGERLESAQSLCLGDAGAPGIVDVDGTPVQLSIGSLTHDCVTYEHNRVDVHTDWMEQVVGQGVLQLVALDAPEPPDPADPTPITPAESGCSCSVASRSPWSGLSSLSSVVSRR